MKLSIRMEPLLEGVGSAHGLFFYSGQPICLPDFTSSVVMELMDLALLGRDIWEPRY